jgi:redox-sensing transcriptional repressor
MPQNASDRTIGRLSLYRRLLNALACEKVQNVYSHQLADAAGATAAQVRRDLMGVGYSGSPTKGYDVVGLCDALAKYLDSPEPQAVALVGVGNLGRAILAYFGGRRPNLSIQAAFDKDPTKAGRVIHGCRCYLMDGLPKVVDEKKIEAAVLAVPATAAQQVADTLVLCGVRGILNFAPVRLRLPEHVYVQDVDMTTLLEKVAFFARRATEGVLT